MQNQDTPQYCADGLRKIRNIFQPHIQNFHQRFQWKLQENIMRALHNHKQSERPRLIYQINYNMLCLWLNHQIKEQNRLSRQDHLGDPDMELITFALTLNSLFHLSKSKNSQISIESIISDYLNAEIQRRISQIDRIKGRITLIQSKLLPSENRKYYEDLVQSCQHLQKQNWGQFLNNEDNFRRVNLLTRILMGNYHQLLRANLSERRIRLMIKIFYVLLGVEQTVSLIYRRIDTERVNRVTTYIYLLNSERGLLKLGKYFQQATIQEMEEEKKYLKTLRA